MMRFHSEAPLGVVQAALISPSLTQGLQNSVALFSKRQRTEALRGPALRSDGKCWQVAWVDEPDRGRAYQSMRWWRWWSLAGASGAPRRGRAGAPFHELRQCLALLRRDVLSDL